MSLEEACGHFKTATATGSSEHWIVSPIVIFSVVERGPKTRIN